MKTKVHYYSAFLAMFIACSGAAPVPQDPDQLGSQGFWVLESWTADPEILTKTTSSPSISFRKGKYFANPGINTMSGNHTAKRNGRIVIHRGLLTERTGDPATTAVEVLFVKLLSSVTRWEVANKILVLLDEASELELRFQVPKPVKALPLAGTEWALEGFERRENKALSFSALITGTTITLSIEADGRATGSSGVNRYFGKAELGQGDRITFAPMASTRRAGPPKAMAQERNYLKQLSEASNWAIDGDCLVLTGKNGSFALRYGAK